MRQPLLIIAGVLAVLSAAYWSYVMLSGEGMDSPEVLAKRALEGDSPEIREQAALDLARSGEEARPHLREVLRKTKDPVVKAGVMGGLMRLQDVPSLPLMIEAVQDPDPNVRGRAVAAVGKIIGIRYPFSSEATTQDRISLMGHMRKAYEKLKANLPPEYEKFREELAQEAPE